MRLASPETMPAKCILFRLWILGSLLDDGIFVTRLKGAEHCDWIMSCSGLRRAIIIGNLSMSSLLEVVSNIVWVWPVIVVYPKETGRKTDGDSLVVQYILHFFFNCNFFHIFILLFHLRRRESMATFILTRWQEATSACFMWFSRSVRPASCTFLIWFTLVRINSGSSVGTSRKLVTPFLVFPHFGKHGLIKKYPLLYPVHIVLHDCSVVAVLS